MSNILDDDFDDYYSIMYGNRICRNCMYFDDHSDGIHGECMHPDGRDITQSNYEACSNYCEDQL